MRRAVLDTHAAIFAWMQPEKLSPGATEIIQDPANLLYFSQVSAIEITLKHKIGKLALPEEPKSYIPSRVGLFSFTYLPLEDDDIFMMSDLPECHRDPFDWLLIGVARRMRLPLISRDAVFGDYPVDTIW